MEQIVVTHKNGASTNLQSSKNMSSVTRATQTVELMGNDIVDITVESATKLQFEIGDKIEIIGRDYTMNIPPKETKISESHFIFELQFEGVQYDLLRASYSVNIDTTTNEIQDLSGDSLTGNLSTFLKVLISNINRVFPNKWRLGTCPDTEVKTLSFGETDNCLSALQTICGEGNFNTEFSIGIDSLGNRTINIGSNGKSLAYTFQYGKGKGLYELSRQKTSNTNIITRLHAYGSTKNINTLKYRALRLCLPDKNKSNSYVENNIAINKYGVWEQTKNFEDIYPHRIGTVTGLGSSVLKFIDSNMNFDLNAKDTDGNTLYLIPSTPAKIHFNTGNLAGFEFEITAYDHAAKAFSLKSYTDENGFTFPSPNSTAFQFAVGDEYVMTDIYQPQSYIEEAEAKLYEQAMEYLTKYCTPNVSYELTLDSLFLKNIVGADVNSNIVWVGDFISIKDDDFNVEKTIRVKTFTRNLLKSYSYQLTIADLPVTITTITRIISELRGIDKIVKINNLNDPAKARRAYLNAQEVLSMVFDTEGNYYSDKIAPLSIETSMLSVGAKSTQLGMIGTVFQVNYGGSANRIVYTGGILTHYSILGDDEKPRIWNIADGDVTLADGAYYVYAKCLKTSNEGVILFSKVQVIVDSDALNYHFLIGVVNSAGENGERAIVLTYGFSTMNGRFIRTGRIESADGATYFDLDSGEFRGNFKFTSGDNIESRINNLQNQAFGKNYFISGNAMESSFTTFNQKHPACPFGFYAKTGTPTGMDGSAIIWGEAILKNIFKSNGNWTISLDVCSEDYFSTSIRIKIPDLFQTDFTTTSDNKIVRKTMHINIVNYGAPEFINEIKIIAISQGNILIRNIKIERGDTATPFRPSDEDVQQDIGNVQQDIGNVQQDIGNVQQDIGNVQQDIGNVQQDIGNVQQDIGNVQQDINRRPLHFTSTPIPPYRIGDFWTDTNVLLRCRNNKLSGNFASSDWEDATSYDNTQTTIDGGLVTSGTVQVAGDPDDGPNVLAGITGNGTTSDSVRMWAGATYANRGQAPFRVLQDGSVVMSKATVEGIVKAISGSIGGFEIAQGRIGTDLSNHGLSLISELIKFSSSTIWSGIGLNTFPASAGFPCLARHELNKAGESLAGGIAMFLKAEFPEDKLDYYFQRYALVMHGNCFSKGGRAHFDNKYIGPAYSDIIENYVKVSHLFVFTEISANQLNIRLPSATVIGIAGDTAYALTILVQHNVVNYLRIKSVSGGQIYNQDAEAVEYIDMAAGDTLQLQYCNGAYYMLTLWR